MDAMALDILYEDNHVLVAVKPCNVPSQADSSGDMDMLSLCKAYIKEKYQKPGAVYLGLVHRLDRPTGGVMVFARTSKAAARLSEQVRCRAMQKTYRLRTANGPADESGILVDTLQKGADGMVRAVPADTPGGKYAELSYQVLERMPGGGSVCEVTLHTGRAHQIRVQFASRGWPLAGDARYGSGGRQLALWAYRLSFLHPIRKERMTFTAPVPPELLR